jgi:hypothetical protein
LLIAFVLSLFYALATRRGEQRRGFYWLFLILFLATWAGGLWLKPFGPSLWGIRWLPFLLAGLIFTIVLALSRPQRPPQSRRETLKMLERVEREKKLERATYVTLSFIFWVLLFVLIVAIGVRYISIY